MASGATKIADRIPAAVLSTASGVLLSWSLGGRRDLLFGVAAFVPLFVLLQRAAQPLTTAVSHSFWAGFSGFGLGCYWAPEAVSLFSGAGLWFGNSAWFVLCTLQALPIAVAGGLVSWLTRLGWPLPVVAPAAFVLAESYWPRPLAHYVGLSAHDQQHLAQLASVGGPTLITAFIIFWAAALANRRQKRRYLLLATLAVFFVAGTGSWLLRSIEKRMEAAPRATIGIVQEALAIGEKHASPRGEVRRHLASTKQLAKTSSPNLVVWPETAVSYRLDEKVEDLGPRLFEGEPGVPVLFGAYQRGYRNGREQLWNSVFLVDATGKKLGAYNKQYLFPLTERIPFAESIKKVAPATFKLPPLSAGLDDGVLSIGNIRAGVMICYEDTFPSLVSELVDAGANVLVSLSNDAWLGETAGPAQHLAASKMRAIEARRSLVRATNTGISVVVGPDGRELARAPVNVPASLVESVPLLQVRSLYGRFGDWPGALALVLSVGGVAWTIRRRL